MVWHLSCCVSLAASFNAGDALGRVDLGVTNASAVLASGDVQVGNWSESPVSVLEEDVRGDLTGDADLIATDEAGGKTARKDCSTIDGGGWKQVRHVPAGRRWHPARDQLRGTAVYGKKSASVSAKAWSIKFNKDPFNEFLFATGDCKKWLIARKWSVMGWYANGHRWIEKSSIKGSRYQARWYRRHRVYEDPWVSLQDYGRSWNRGMIMYGGRGYGGHQAGTILPRHQGANVFIRRKVIKKTCASLDGGGWKRVRHVPAGYNWHPATDQLVGNVAYGKVSDDVTAPAWSIKFNKTPFNQFLFATGDCKKWLVARKWSVMGWYSNGQRVVQKSSIKGKPYFARWYRRHRVKEDPWVSLEDHGRSWNKGKILYGGKSWGNWHSASILPLHEGADVYIRNVPIKKTCANLDGGGWKRVRHVPAGFNWHPATDQLAGTAVYGKQSDDSTAPAWSIKFDKEKFNQFLFATGDCQKWLIARRWSVLGRYANGQRWIEKSSIRGSKYKARWYRRNRVGEDPWVSLEDHGRSWNRGGILYGGRSYANWHAKSILPLHEGADVYIRQIKIKVPDCSKLDGGGWTLVRHLPAGYNWHPSRDQLRGTDVYGTKADGVSARPWSIKFDKTPFNQFLFATGDCKKWLIARKWSVMGWYANGQRWIEKSSIKGSRYQARWYRRHRVGEDPWVSLEDYGRSWNRGKILYGGRGYGGHQAATVLPKHEGANVFIRQKTIKKTCASLDGGGWKRVRHVPAGYNWHPATDQLRGTAKYGKKSEDVTAPAWSVKFDKEKFNQFMFATGDCKKWLVAKKWAVMGWYANGQRWIEKSSSKGSRYMARWYRRHRVGEDPWVSLEDHGRSWNRGKILYGGRSYANWHAASILPMHEGADVYIRQKEIKVKDCSKVDGGGWKLVRHIPARNHWHPARDHLRGTAKYGKQSTDVGANPWSIKFDKTPFNEFLFATGDCQRWLITRRWSVMAAYANQHRWIEKSSQKSQRYAARWYHRWHVPHEPWISITDHGPAVHSGHIVYAGNNFGNIHASRVLPKHLGARVWIRNKVVTKSCASLDGGGWKRVRHVPAGYHWHPARDQLRGTAVYGKKTGDVTSPAWSVKFDKEKFNQFMFATGDCKKWLVAKKWSVMGWYANGQRWIEKSSFKNKRYQARWYRRHRVPEDPWVSLEDHGRSWNRGGILYGAKSWGNHHAGTILPVHEGADVYIRFKAVKVKDCSKLDGGGWKLVRHVPGRSQWHPARDHLKGTAVYGTPSPEPSANPWSIKFDKTPFNEFLFATGDCTRWLITRKWAVYGNYANNPRWIEKSSQKNGRYQARWYHRWNVPHEPWISINDHGPSVHSGHIVYAGNNFGNIHASRVLPNHLGANVWIRNKVIKKSCAHLDGGGWKRVRHVPAGYNWHPATDQLVGNVAYGTKSDDVTAPAWSIKFDKDNFNQFLFATGDCKKWLVAKKWSVMGWYANGQRWIEKSSKKGSKYQARWYRRHRVREDPWVSLEDHGRSWNRGGILYGGKSWANWHARSILPVHEGADVYIRSKIVVSTCASLDGGGWKRVRHVPAGNHWHPATDQLQGTVAYGRKSVTRDAPAWSIRFDKDNFNQFLFATGDCKKWLIAKRWSVMGWYANQPRWIEKSSFKNHRYTARWYRRHRVREDPWVSLEDHGRSWNRGGILYGGRSWGNWHAKSILPMHGGADVYIRYKAIKVKDCSLTDGGGWKLVRHVPARNTWHPARDHLRGTAKYGTPSKSVSAAPWSIKFDKTPFNEFLFATGDCQRWLIARKWSVMAAYANNPRWIEKSSQKSRRYQARWYNRWNIPHEPWISVTDHGSAVHSGHILYGENNFGNIHASRVLPKHLGARVWIRNKQIKKTCAHLNGGGWTRVRHVPAGFHWHPARDQLKGTAAYGKKSEYITAPAWSTRFDSTQFNQFMFATGDCKKWLVAKKWSVMGWYANGPRWIEKSSKFAKRYKARWYRRHRNKEDPWITLQDHGHSVHRGDTLYGENRYPNIHASRVLPVHEGADVYIRQKAIKVKDCAKLDGGGWKWVRHVPPGDTWHPARDQLQGTAKYGTPSKLPSAAAWSVKFDKTKYNQFLFATGDCQRWLISYKASVMGWYANAHRYIEKSSQRSTRYRARWYRRHRAKEDPWISITDHGSAVHSGHIVYGENNYGNIHASRVLPSHLGANVFIRYKVTESSCSHLDGGGWRRVRHVPPGTRWHPARDQLRGTEQYGSVSRNVHAAAWTVKFNKADFNEFLFATGDCKKWLVARKWSVMGWYANGHRWIEKSSKFNRRYQARWYRRHRNQEDPWITLQDHGHSVHRGDTLYGERSYGNIHASRVLPVHQGADVYIRKKVIKKSCRHLDGGTWQRVRHVPAGYNWHPATDQLVGNVAYGRKSDDVTAPAWSVKFHGAKFNEFLFATGDCKKWLVAKKWAVMGWYHNGQRWIAKSSLRNKRYMARWYRRHRVREDPWVSLEDHGRSWNRGGILYGGKSWGNWHAASILPLHEGADVYIRNKAPKIRDCSLIDGGGWKLVRHVPGRMKWHPARDHLRGTAKYGTPSKSPSAAPWSIKFDKTPFNEFLFATGDCQRWLITRKWSVMGSYANSHRWIEKSSQKNSRYAARWYHRWNIPHEPWISITDHGPSVHSGHIVYAGNNFGNIHASRVLPNHMGANVWIRKKVVKKTCAHLDGGGWTRVRHVPAGYHWHPATDQLAGTAVYGSKSDDVTAPAWSVKFDKTQFNEFLFATGDCKKWLVAKKWSVMGTYANNPRWIVRSSFKNKRYTARWYRRKNVKEDPWVSLEDHGRSWNRGGILYGGKSWGNHHAGTILPAHEGADVYIRQKTVKLKDCSKLDGGGWKLVRHVPPGFKWHPARDHLRGTAKYGTPSKFPSAPAWSIKFDKTPFTEFLFATGDCQRWLIAKKFSVMAAYANQPRWIEKSSQKNSRYQARWYNRWNIPHEPWISATDHGSAVHSGHILYGENNFGNIHASRVLPNHLGANVWIRNKVVKKSCAHLDGGGWTRVRHVPAGYKWHPAKDDLQGTAVYGSPSDNPDAPAWSKKFDKTQFNQFLFATGDCSKWLVARKWAVQGQYAGRRYIERSSTSSKRYTAQWYSRRRYPWEPWVSLSNYGHSWNRGKILYGEASYGNQHASSILPKHQGADVYIRQKKLKLADCTKLDGGGWRLVRHVPPGDHWHPARDDLQGTARYGTPSKFPSAPAWSIPFKQNKFNQFLFATGDCEKWLVAPRYSVQGQYAGRRVIAKSSTNSKKYTAQWYSRRRYPWEPWVTLKDWRFSWNRGLILYGEAGYGNVHAKAILPKHFGANVYIRDKIIPVPDSSRIDGGGWKMVRHVPPGYNWHPAKDDLQGTAVYGKKSKRVSAPAWSVKFDKDTFNEFLFATGDGKKWLIAPRWSVQGQFANRRQVIKSSVSNKRYTAQWYSRRRYPWEPWVTLKDWRFSWNRGQILYGEASYGNIHASKVLPFHYGANVFIRQKNYHLPDCSKLDGGGWRMVRHVPAGYNWHPAKDDLQGTSVYGTPSKFMSAPAWSVNFKNTKFNEFLFATGDCKKWLVAPKWSAQGQYTNNPRWVKKSSISGKSYRARWYSRRRYPWEPWVTLKDWGHSHNRGQILYGEASYGHIYASKILPFHFGANVFIRQKVEQGPNCGRLAGGGWKKVRHVPAGTTWHPSRDQLRGTARYGTPSEAMSAPAWSVPFNTAHYNEFLFATGDCKKWLVARKTSVLGWYANHKRRIESSSLSAKPSSARWYRRHRNKEDPWVSLTDHHVAYRRQEILFGEASTPHHTQVLIPHGGADVFIRHKILTYAWRRIRGTYSPGYARNANGKGSDSRVRTLAAAMKACDANKNCHAVTCERGSVKRCTLRSSKTTRTSPSGEHTLIRLGEGGEGTWHKRAGVYSGGYAKKLGKRGLDRKVRTLTEATKACSRNRNCKAVTCRRGSNRYCTLRKSTTLRRSPSREHSYIPFKGGMSFSWEVGAGVYSPGYARKRGGGHDKTVRSLAESRKACLANPRCKAVTCDKTSSRCTLRGSSHLRGSPSFETTYRVLVSGGKGDWWRKRRMYSGGYAKNRNGRGYDSTVRSLAESQVECLGNRYCKAVTCRRGRTNSCTLRRSPGLHRSPSGEDTYLPYVKPKPIQWSWLRTNGQYSGGFAKGDKTVRDLAAAKKACLANDACMAVTCDKAVKKCTVRASTIFKKSPSGEVSFRPVKISWKRTNGHYSGGYPNNVGKGGVDSARRSYQKSEKACLANPNCKAITCRGSTCTLRKSKNLARSPSGERTYQPVVVFRSPSCSALDGGGWRLVRHVPAGFKWHPARDQLRGTARYGRVGSSTSANAWTVPFNREKFNEFLFATGDCQKWLVAKKWSVMGWYANQPRFVEKSSANHHRYKARWYRRHRNREDPWISITDHGPAVKSGDIVYGENNAGNAHASKILPMHMGANVYIRQKVVKVPDMRKIDGGGWRLVRHVPEGLNWHPAKDQLRGTAKYGKKGGPHSSHAWSIPFAGSKFDEFLFATGDGKKWLIAKKASVLGWYSNGQREILKSSTSAKPYKARWYRRHRNREDPWISIVDHGPAVKSGGILYGENNVGLAHASTILPMHMGANVYIRQKGKTYTPGNCKNIDGGDWLLVRHVPAGNRWHPAKDRLAGRVAYGIPGTELSSAAWSVRFAQEDFDEFLFATGDCEKWLVAKKNQVYGTYANAPRWVQKSSARNSRYRARWYNRNNVREDPWISIGDHFPSIKSGNIVYGEGSYGRFHATTVLPKHKGANVFIRKSKPAPKPGTAAQLDGGGWRLVRHVPAGRTWHPAKDQLRGTSEYGTPGNELSSTAFSVSFHRTPFDQFLFATGDVKQWVIASKASVMGWYSNVPRQVKKTSEFSGRHTVKWYRRHRNKEDPWISTVDHGAAVRTGKIVYGENNAGGVHASRVLPVHMGANVFVRNIKDSVYPGNCAALEGGGWQLVRHVPAGTRWHPATDRLLGTHAYGKAGNELSRHSWSIRFDKATFDEFLFSTGDCRKWLVATKQSVLGWYSNAPRTIKASSLSATPTKARWYRRKSQKEDPWISLTDHASAIKQGNILYGEAFFGHSHAKNILPIHQGANVFIRVNKGGQSVVAGEAKKAATKEKIGIWHTKGGAKPRGKAKKGCAKPKPLRKDGTFRMMSKGFANSINIMINNFAPKFARAVIQAQAGTARRAALLATKSEIRQIMSDHYNNLSQLTARKALFYCRYIGGTNSAKLANKCQANAIAIMDRVQKTDMAKCWVAKAAKVAIPKAKAAARKAALIARKRLIRNLRPALKALAWKIFYKGFAKEQAAWDAKQTKGLTALREKKRRFIKQMHASTLIKMKAAIKGVLNGNRMKDSVRRMKVAARKAARSTAKVLIDKELGPKFNAAAKKAYPIAVRAALAKRLAAMKMTAWGGPTETVTPRLRR